MADYLRPSRLEEALEALMRPHTVLAGGTDFYPARVGRAIDENILDIGGIDTLRGISASNDGWRFSLNAPSIQPAAKLGVDANTARLRREVAERTFSTPPAVGTTARQEKFG